jgi:hypothetical protein
VRGALLLLMLAAPAAAQTVATSAAPNAVAVTVYRAPGRPADQPMELSWLNGFALITETRSIAIPQGLADIRFEGVAGGIIPESAIVTGLPDGVVEKNQDAALLSPGSLLDAYLGRRVHLRRTSETTGKVTEQEAVIRSGADGAVVLQTEAGFEALRCTGLSETLVYPEVPAGLSAKPTLSVRTESERATSATVTLSYLATGFDWQANYVATLSPDEKSVDLFAWVTLANGDETSFRDASTNAVAGRLNTADMHRREPPRAKPLNLRCWPSDTTTDVPGKAPPPPPPPPPPPAAMMAPPPPAPERDAESIVVTGSRIAKQEELGDLKLYRIPEPVTVAANSQKQVAMIDKESVPVDLFYRSRLVGEHTDGVRRILRMENERAAGLGLPLPAGGFTLYRELHGRPFLLGEGSTEDKAVGERVDVELEQSPNVHLQVRTEDDGDKARRIVLTVTNALPKPVRYEAEIRQGGVEELTGFPRGVVREDGKWLWRVTVPANGSRTLSYREVRPD